MSVELTLTAILPDVKFESFAGVGETNSVEFGAVVSFTVTDKFVVYEPVTFVVTTVILYVPGVDDVALNEKYRSVRFITRPSLLQLKTVLVFVNVCVPALVAFVPATNVKLDGMVALTEEMFPVNSVSVLFALKLNKFDTSSSTL